MEPLIDKASFAKSLLHHLETTYSAKNKEELQFSQAWLKDNSRNPSLISTLSEIICSNLQSNQFSNSEKDLRTAALTYLRTITSDTIENMKFLCTAFLSPLLNPYVAKDMAKSLITILTKFPQSELISMIDNLPIKKEQGNLLLKSNSILLASAIIEADVIDQDQISGIFQKLNS